MRSWEKRLAVLETLYEREQASQHDWVLDNDIPESFQQSVESAVREGLAELAGRETRAELSAYEGRPIRWAARLTPFGGDARVYANARAVDEPIPEEPASGEQLVKLRPAQMAALRVFISVRFRSRLHRCPKSSALAPSEVSVVGDGRPRPSFPCPRLRTRWSPMQMTSDIDIEPPRTPGLHGFIGRRGHLSSFDRLRTPFGRARRPEIGGTRWRREN